jgi:hypothetical protein
MEIQLGHRLDDKKALVLPVGGTWPGKKREPGTGSRGLQTIRARLHGPDAKMRRPRKG